MEELFCTKCGNKISSEENFCAKCGAPRAGMNIGQIPPQPMQTPHVYYPPASAYKAPATRQSVPVLVLFIVSGVVLLGAIGYGIWRLWLDKPVVNTASIVKTDASIQTPSLPTQTSGVIPSPTSLPTVTPTQVPLPSPSPTPAPTPTPSTTPPIPSQLVYTDFIGTSDVPGMNEVEVKELIGEPKSRNEQDTEEGKITELGYDTFSLSFPEITGNVPFCSSIRIFDGNCPVSVCGLSAGMTKDAAESMLLNTQFIFSPTLDQTNLEYYNAELNQYIFVEYQDGKVKEFTAMRGD